MSELAKALADLQTQLPKIRKSEAADTGSYTYHYADLAAISQEILPLLGKLGLSFTTRPTVVVDGESQRFVLAYSLLHSSGEKLDGEYPLPLGAPPQAVGSAISYGRRYCLCAVTGIAPEDDDGAAAQVAAQQRQEEPRRRSEPPAITGGQMKALHAAFNDLGITKREDRLDYTANIIKRDVASSKELTKSEASQVIDSLKKQLDEAAAADAKAAAESGTEETADV